MQHLRYPTPSVINQILIPLGRTRFAIIDPEDWEYLSCFSWRCRRSHSNCYAVRKVRIGTYSETIFMHRQIIQAPPELEVHHINHNTLDNRRSNLMLLTPSAHHQIHSALRLRSAPQQKTALV